jgi:shikimate kinase
LTETQNIVLIGFMGTGKSAVGRVLARRLGWRHLDTDIEIEAAAGKTIPQIWTEEGESAFRTRESAFLSSLTPPSLTGKGAGRLGSLILSTGGGTPLRPENAELLKQIGIVVWLHVTPEAILSRVARSLHERPLLAAHRDDPLGRIQTLLADRAPRYAALADHTLETSNCADSEEATDRLMTLLSLSIHDRMLP